MLNTRNVIVKRCKCNYLFKKIETIMITPAVHAILFFATTLLPEHLCHLQNFLELLLSTLNYGIIFAHNANVQWRRCSLKCGNQSQASR